MNPDPAKTGTDVGIRYIEAGSAGTIEIRVMGDRILAAESGRRRLFQSFRHGWIRPMKSPSGQIWAQLWNNQIRFWQGPYQDLGTGAVVVEYLVLSMSSANQIKLDHPFTEAERKNFVRPVVRLTGDTKFSFELKINDDSVGVQMEVERLLEQAARSRHIELFPDSKIYSGYLRLHVSKDHQYLILLYKTQETSTMGLPIQQDDGLVDYCM